MSRSGYIDDAECWQFALYRGNVTNATRGRRGQAFFCDMAAALDAMPVKTLIADSLVDDSGGRCALGVLGERRGLPVEKLDPEFPEAIAKQFDIATCLARETTFINDEDGPPTETPEARWLRVRAWVETQIAIRRGGDGE